MKKEYLEPSIVTIKLCSMPLLQTVSIEISNEEEDDPDSDKSRAYERNSMLWEEDE